MRRDDLDVLALLAAADVVGLARRALAQHELDPGAVILDVEPVADLAAVAVDRQRLALERVRDNSGISFSGYWFGPYVFEPRVIEALTPNVRT